MFGWAGSAHTKGIPYDGQRKGQSLGPKTIVVSSRFSMNLENGCLLILIVLIFSLILGN